MPDEVKKPITIAVICAVVFYILICINGCNETENNPTNTIIQTYNMIGVNALVELPIGDGLYYDYTTGIVYWWNGTLDIYIGHATTPTPYYSPNGLLYRYVPETNMLEEIKPYSTSMKGEK